MVRNVLEINPGRCSRVVADYVGYEVVDSAGRSVLRVRTGYAEDGPGAGTWVTTIGANCYDRNGNLVFAANSGEAGERIEANTKALFGWPFQMSNYYSDEEKEIARAVFPLNGKVHQVVTGEIVGQRIELDGKLLYKARIRDCDILIRTGDFMLVGGELTGNRINLEGPAGLIHYTITASRSDE